MTQAGAPNNPPAPPVDSGPPGNWPHVGLFKRVKEALFALPVHFKSRTIIEGLHAQDLHTLNTPIGAVIEDQVVETLNSLRGVWDPQGAYPTHAFRRQPQTFPDVLLISGTPGSTPILGIELKGWYLLAKESVPTFRMQQSADACAEADLLVVVPWVLSNILSGTPKVFRPYISGTKFAAQFRTHYWQHLRKTKGNTSITFAPGCQPYPKKSDRILDEAADDSGGNFGRVARTGVMDEYCAELLAEPLSGIPANSWRTFFKSHGGAQED